jgi:hypothetical protein
MVRPAFSQSAIYDLSWQSETEVRFKGAVIRVLSAGNAEVLLYHGGAIQVVTPNLGQHGGELQTVMVCNGLA